jgi:plasmid stabilization system protein ParE
MRLLIHPDAVAEYADAVAHYERQQSGLGLRFVATVEPAMVGILENPVAWPVLADNVRRRLTRTFPYAILFYVDGHSVIVVAVMHCHQQPGYWQARTLEA